MAKDKAAQADAETKAERKGRGQPVPWRPTPDLSRLRGEVDRFVEDFMQSRSPFGSGQRGWPELFGQWPLRELERGVPAVDVYEEKDAIVMKAELPGMEKNDVQVSMSGDMLTIRGEKKREESMEEGEYYRHERSYGAFTRSVRLPAEVQAEKATATFKKGVLEIRFPKSEEAKRKSVAIQVK